jgi:dihydroneopterin aldolase/2-amino-4-hydroxy-6-hydroxymethyldihydropteridine diphosphokinase
MDHIHLTGLRAEGFHGVFPDERRDGQTFFIDVSVGLALEQAAADDDLTQTVHYGELASKIVENVESDPVDLIETVAERLCALVLSDTRIDEVTVTIHKPQAPITVPFGDVAVTMTRTRLARPSRAVIAIGSNLGARSATILSAVSVVAQLDGVRLLAISDLHDTVALKLDGPDQDAPRYLNAVAIVETTLDPEGLLQMLQGIEAQFGRTREVVWGDRTLDLDLIDFDGLEQQSTTLILPHPRAAERDFVLAPWLEADPAATLAGHGSVRELLDEVLRGAAAAESGTGVS